MSNDIKRSTTDTTITPRYVTTPDAAYTSAYRLELSRSIDATVRAGWSMRSTILMRGPRLERGGRPRIRVWVRQGLPNPHQGPLPQRHSRRNFQLSAMQIPRNAEQCQLET